MNKKLFPLYTITLLLMVLPVVASAQSGAPSIDVDGILGRIKELLLIIFNGLVIIMVIYTGIKYLTAKGEPSKINEANKALMWTTIGIGVGLLANSANALIKNLLGIS